MYESKKKFWLLHKHHMEKIHPTDVFLVDVWQHNLISSYSKYTMIWYIICLRLRYLLYKLWLGWPIDWYNKLSVINWPTGKIVFFSNFINIYLKRKVIERQRANTFRASCFRIWIKMYNKMEIKTWIKPEFSLFDIQ